MNELNASAEHYFKDPILVYIESVKECLQPTWQQNSIEFRGEFMEYLSKSRT